MEKTARYAGVVLIALLSVLIRSAPATAQQAPPGPVAGPLAEDTRNRSAPDRPASEQPAPESNPAVLQILESQPQSPGDRVRAAELLLSLQRPELARQQLEGVPIGQLSDQELAGLEERHGPGVFVRFSMSKDLAPVGQQLAQRVFAATHRIATDPERIRGLIQQLGGESPIERRVAVRGLLAARGHAVGPLLVALAQAEEPARQARHRAVLVAMGSDAVSPARAVLDSADPAVRRAAVLALGDLARAESLPYLIEPLLSSDPALRRLAARAFRRVGSRVPDKTEALEFLTRQAERFADPDWAPRPDAYVVGGFVVVPGSDAVPGSDVVPGSDAVPGSPDPAQLVAVWQWDPHSESLVPVQLPRAAARAVEAVRLYRALTALQPANEGHRIAWMAARLEAVRSQLDLTPAAAEQDAVRGRETRTQRTGRETRAQRTRVDLEPAPMAQDAVLREALQMGSKELESVLVFALDCHWHAAAMTVSELLGQTGDRQLLASMTGQPRPLVLAVTHPDRRVGFAAAGAIVALDPPGGFAGSGNLIQAAVFFASSIGQPRALVAHPNPLSSSEPAAVLRQLGYLVDEVPTGGHLLSESIESGDYELVLVSAAIDHPRLDQVLRQLRRDFRTVALPVGILASPAHWGRAESAAATYAPAVAMAERLPVDAWQQEIGRLVTMTAATRVSPNMRLEQARQAVKWLVRLTDPDPDRMNYDLGRYQRQLEGALAVPQLASDIQLVLKRIGRVPK